ncbi:MAG TPA: hypothetical protein VMT85_17665 [Thermoanaerobaculia bacterium]|nr:hypothetical protein [Thermoanaerobaculia bacterium]
MSGADFVESREVHAVEGGRWSDFERLFENRGGPKYCWCMAWRATPEEVKRTDNASRKAAMVSRVESGVPVGLYGLRDVYRIEAAALDLAAPCGDPGSAARADER